MDCEGFAVRKADYGIFKGQYYVSSLKSMPEGEYLHEDLTVHSRMSNGRGKFNYTSKEEAEDRLRRFQEMCTSKKIQGKSYMVETSVPTPVAEKLDARIKPAKMKRNFLIDFNGEGGSLEANFEIRLVHAEEGDEANMGKVFLEVATPRSEDEFIRVARLEFKDGKVVMYREREAFDPYINTDELGRIQN